MNAVDLYSELLPRSHSRSPTEKMFFPLNLKPPDVFLKVPRGTSPRRGSATTRATHRALQLLVRLDRTTR